MKFYGNKIHCGSYACLNVIKDSSIDASLFEASTATAFGIKHYKSQNFDRLLTTLYDPNKGLDEALRLWGYTVLKQHFRSAQELIQYLKETLPVKKMAILGPIDMGKLRYQPVPDIVNRMDHYIVLESYSDSQILCIDSEGFYHYLIDYDQMENWISIDDIPEAENRVTLRYIDKTSDYSRAKIIHHTVIRASHHLNEAEQIGQGSNAIYQCCRFLQEQDCFSWKLSFLYDLQYLKQRKSLFQWFLCELQKLHTNLPIDEVKSLISSQEILLGQMYFALRWENRLAHQELNRMGDLERELSKAMNFVLHSFR